MYLFTHGCGIIERRVTTNRKTHLHGTFVCGLLFANGKAEMKPVQTDQDPRFESFAQTLASLARRLFEDPR